VATKEKDSIKEERAAVQERVGELTEGQAAATAAAQAAAGAPSADELKRAADATAIELEALRVRNAELEQQLGIKRKRGGKFTAKVNLGLAEPKGEARNIAAGDAFTASAAELEGLVEGRDYE
jgi:hypothetical protein